jgi:hypothetical protein
MENLAHKPLLDRGTVEAVLVSGFTTICAHIEGHRLTVFVKLTGNHTGIISSDANVARRCVLYSFHGRSTHLGTRNERSPASWIVEEAAEHECRAMRRIPRTPSELSPTSLRTIWITGSISSRRLATVCFKLCSNLPVARWCVVSVNV